jgi:carboxypeptidase family protein/TonB-dependent receptor-like protein
MYWSAVLRACLTVVCVLVSASRAPAQLGSGSLHGRVVDARGTALGGVRVSIGGPGVEQSQLTGSDGRFRFLTLPPGSYAVKVTREGVTPAGHPNVTVRVGRATVIQITASPGGHHILGASESAMLDSRLVATGANFRLEQLEALPFAPDLASVLQSTPGVALDLVNVGGSTTGERATAVFRGAPRDANTWTVDGVTLTDMSASGLAPRYFEFALLEEIQTVTGGPDIQQMTAGLGVNLVTKRGTNLFQGQGRAYLSDGASVGGDVQPPGGAHFDGAVDFGAEAGGAIVRNKLWYFGGLDGVSSDRTALSANDIASRDFSRTSLLGKISLNAGRNALTGSVFTSGLDREGEGAGALRAPSALWNDDGRTTIFRVEDSAVLGANWFVTALAGLVDTGFTLNPDATGSAHVDSSGIFRDGFERLTADRSSKEARLNLTGYFGAHEIQAGGGYRSVSDSTLYEWPGSVVTAGSGTPVTLMILPPDRDVSARANNTSAWVQDTISHGRLTANLGVRFDVQRGRNRESVAMANPLSPLVPAATFDGGDDGWSWTSLSPRLGVTYAVGRDQTMLVRASFSRYPDQLGLDRVLLFNPIAPIAGRQFDGSEMFAFFDANGNRVVDPSEVRSASAIVGVATSDPRFLVAPSQVAEDFDPPMTNELLLGVDRLVGRGALSAHLQLRNRSGIADDVPLVAAGTGQRAVVFDDFGLGPLVPVTDLDGTPIVLQTFDLNAPWSYTGGVFMSNGAREQRAMNLTLQYDQRYVRGAYMRAWINFGRAEWTVPSTFFVDRNDLLGGDDNDDAPVADQSASPARSGVFLHNNWSYELLGMTRAPYGLELALRVYGRQGYPAPVFVTVEAIDATRLIQAASVDRDRFARLLITDLRIGRAFAVAKFNLDVSAEIFNLFNRQTVLQRDTDLISPFRGSDIEVLSPRVMRFGVRVRF